MSRFISLRRCASALVAVGLMLAVAACGGSQVPTTQARVPGLAGKPSSFDDLEPPTEEGSRPLEELETGRRATFTRVSDSDPAMLRYLADRGIRPGVELSTVAKGNWL